MKSGISSIEDANAFISEFVEVLNAKFAKPPRNPHDAHRPLLTTETLGEIFTWQEQRKISKDLVVHFKRKKLHIDVTPENKHFIGQQCTVLERSDGSSKCSFSHVTALCTTKSIPLCARGVAESDTAQRQLVFIVWA